MFSLYEIHVPACFRRAVANRGFSSPFQGLFNAGGGRVSFQERSDDASQVWKKPIGSDIYLVSYTSTVGRLLGVTLVPYKCCYRTGV